MPTTPKGVSFSEFGGYPQIDITNQGMVAQRKFKIAWDDWERFAEEIYGVYVDVGGTVQYEKPLPFPGNRELLLPDTMKIAPYGGEGAKIDSSSVTSMTSGTNLYPYGGAEVLVSYRERFDGQPGTGGQSTISVPEGTYVTFDGDLGVENITLPNRSFKWEHDNAPLPSDINPALLVPTGQFTLTWHNVLRPPYSAMSSLRGTVNNATFYGASVGTLLYLGSTLNRTFAVRSSREKATLWTIGHKFAEKRINIFADVVIGGWNYFYDPRDQGWHRIVSTDENDTMYTGGDFATLFQMG